MFVSKLIRDALGGEQNVGFAMLLRRTGGTFSRVQDKLSALFVPLGLVTEQRDASTSQSPETVIEHGCNNLNPAYILRLIPFRLI